MVDTSHGSNANAITNIRVLDVQGKGVESGSWSCTMNEKLRYLISSSPVRRRRRRRNDSELDHHHHEKQ